MIKIEDEYQKEACNLLEAYADARRKDPNCNSEGIEEILIMIADNDLAVVETIVQLAVAKLAESSETTNPEKYKLQS